MFVPAPPAAVSESAPSLEAAFAMARAAALPAAASEGDLLGAGAVAVKLAAIDALHSAIPTEPKARQIAALDELSAAASSARNPEVRAKALAYLGYAMPQVNDDDARARGLKVLLDALKSPPYRIYALRGLGPACHGLPPAEEAGLQGALLDLLDGPVAGEERQTAFLALYAFVSTHNDLAVRARPRSSSSWTRVCSRRSRPTRRASPRTPGTPPARARWPWPAFGRRRGTGTRWAIPPRSRASTPCWTSWPRLSTTRRSWAGSRPIGTPRRPFRRPSAPIPSIGRLPVPTSRSPR